MKKNIKFMAVLTAFILLITSFTVISVSAAGVSYSATDVSGKKGDTVTVTVSISSDIEIWGANVMLGYDSTELQYVESNTGDAASSGSLHNTGSSVNYSGMFAKTNGTVFTVKFKILKSSGTSTLKLTGTENTDYDGKTYDCTVKNATVTVTSGSTVIGDANGDGKVTAVDARIILQDVAGINKLSSAQQKLADVNKDDKITAVDARMVLQIVAGIK